MSLRRLAVFLPLFVVSAFLFSRVLGCSSQPEENELDDVDASITHVQPTTCSSPAQGCPCTEGTTAPCGRVDLSRDGFKQCSYGSYTCTAAGTWSACEGAVQVQSLLAKPRGTLHAQDEQMDASSCGDADPCDPYCSGFTDTPTGISPLPPGLTIADGGLTLAPTTDGGDGGIPGGELQTTGNGQTGCGMVNAGIGGCTGPGPECWQDFRCDVGSHTCTWNGGAGYFDNTVAGGDLNIGAACSFGGTTTTFPVCNRGSLPIAAGAALNITFVPGASPPDPCTPVMSAPTCSSVVPTGGLVPGACLNVPCTIPAGGGFAVLNPGDPDGLEATAYCGNNAAAAQTSNGADTTCASCTYCNTTVTGNVKDPGLNPDGLRDITVYELAGPSGIVPALPPLAGGATPPPCDSCDSLLPAGTYTVGANTDNDGNFTLTNVTPGPHQTLVSQTGRWRRKATNINIQACQPNSLTDDQIRLPKNQGEGDIPKIALVMGGAESLECWLLKVGIDPNEMQAYSAMADTSRVQLFFETLYGPGIGLTVRGGGFAPSPDAALWSPSGPLNEFSAVVMSCNGGGVISEGSAPRQRMFDYVNAGGRLFLDHWHGLTWLENSSAPYNWDQNDVATWNGGDVQPPPMHGHVLDTSPAQQKMHDWLGAHAASPFIYSASGVGWVDTQQPRYDTISAGTATTEWIRGEFYDLDWLLDPGGDMSLSFSFETPVGGPACGRVLFNDMHASSTRTASVGANTVVGDFPTGCFVSGIDLTPEEKALEYQFFQLTACALGGAPPPPPPPPPPALMSVTFTRDFHAECPAGTKLVWQAFNWEADLPAGTSLEYFAATAPDNPDGGAPDLPATVTAAPATVPIGTASVTTLAPYWGTDANTVDWHLQHEPPGPQQVSQAWLRVYMVLVPTATQSPTLYDWQQLYDCQPDQ